MLLLIDGYNLLHQSDLMGRGRGDRWLQRARERLLRQLQQHLDEPLAAQTCVVFDAESPPPDRSHEYFHSGIRVLYAVGYPEADDLVEELIARHDAPQRLTVVSSDHRLQRAARRRRAHAINSDSWYQRLLESGPQLGIRWPPQSPPLPDGPPTVPEKLEGIACERDVKAWMAWFEQAEVADDQAVPRVGEPPSSPDASPNAPIPPRDERQPKQKPRSHEQPNEPYNQRGSAKKARADARRKPAGTGRSRRRDRRLGTPDKQIDPSIENPFPEGYGEDLLEGEDDV